MPDIPTMRFITRYEMHAALIDRFVEAMLPAAVSLIGLPIEEPDELWNEAMAKQCYALAYALIDEKVRREKEQQP